MKFDKTVRFAVNLLKCLILCKSYFGIIISKFEVNWKFMKLYNYTDNSGITREFW